MKVVVFDNEDYAEIKGNRSIDIKIVVDDATEIASFETEDENPPEVIRKIDKQYRNGTIEKDI